MKRELLENVKVKPYTSGDAIDREGYLSAVLGVSLGAATGAPTGITVKVTFTECDTEGGSYTPVADKLVVPGKTTKAASSTTSTSTSWAASSSSRRLSPWSAPAEAPRAAPPPAPSPSAIRTCSRCKEGDGYVQSV